MLTVEELPIRPKTHAYKRGRTRQLLAVVMPMPTYTGLEPCVGVESFTSERNSQDYLQGEEVEGMRQLCAGCPVVVSCSEYAIAHERYFFWGGLTAAQRMRVRAKRGQALVDLTRSVDTARPK